MERGRGGSARSAVAFVVLALSALATLVWSLRAHTGGTLLASTAPQAGPGSIRDAGAQLDDARRPASEHGAAPGPTQLFVDSGGAALTLTAGSEDAPRLSIVQGGARVDETGPGGPLRVLPTGEEGPWTLALARGAPWSLEVAGGAERLELELAGLELGSLRVEAPAGAFEGTLPRSGRCEVFLGVGRSVLRLSEGSDADLRLTLGFGPLVLSAEAGARGRVELVPGFGPATLIVDAGVKVALELPPGEPPPLALQGTWWRHESRGPAGAVTWARGPAAASPEAADLRLVVTAPLKAPLAVTYR
jgi:hypothetical protein